MAEMQQQLMNQQAIQDQANQLYNLGLVKQHEDGQWVAVNSMEEKDRILQARQEETQKLMQL